MLIEGITPVVLCAAYIPSPVQKPVLTNFIENFNRVSELCKSHVCVIGDFNLTNLDWRLVGSPSYKLSQLYELFVDFVNVNNLKQCSSTKNCMGRTLDLVLARLPSCTVAEAIDILVPVDPLHPPLFIEISFKSSPNLQSNTIQRLNF